MTRRVYVTALHYLGMGEVIAVRRDGRLVVETPSGKRVRVQPDCVRYLGHEYHSPPPLDEPARTQRSDGEAVPKEPAVRRPANRRAQGHPNAIRDPVAVVVHAVCAAGSFGDGPEDHIQSVGNAVHIAVSRNVECVQLVGIRRERRWR